MTIDELKNLIEDASSQLDRSRTDHRNLTARFQEEIEKTVNDESLKLEEHMVIVLQQAKEDPSRIRTLLDAARLNYDKDLAANEVAKNELDIEWANISSWLSEFTRKLPSNFDLMKQRFAPKKDQNQKFISAGFVIDAQVINHEDIEYVLRDIVRDIEDYEENQYIKNNSEVRRDAQASFRNQIRNKFYRRVIVSPSIKVFIPSISRVKAEAASLVCNVESTRWPVSAD